MNNLPTKKYLITEVITLYLIQTVIIALLSLFGSSFSSPEGSSPEGFSGLVPALAGIIFIILPVIIMDKTDKPYNRYFLKFSNPLKDLPVITVSAIVTWMPIIIFVLMFPAIWNISNPSFKLVWPLNYTQIAATHILIVALPEEFFYRGYLLGRLDDIFTTRKRILGVSTGAGLFISSALFAIGHFIIVPNPSRLLVFFPSLLFGWLRYRQKTITAPVIYHAGSNIFMDLFRASIGL